MRQQTLSDVQTTMSEDRLEACASFCKSIATTFQNRLQVWTISLALEPADCVLYFKTKMAVNKTMSG